MLQYWCPELTMIPAPVPKQVQLDMGKITYQYQFLLLVFRLLLHFIFILPLGHDDLIWMIRKRTITFLLNRKFTCDAWAIMQHVVCNPHKFQWIKSFHLLRVEMLSILNINGILEVFRYVPPSDRLLYTAVVVTWDIGQIKGLSQLSGM